MRGVALAGCLALTGPAVLCHADTRDINAVEDPHGSPPGGPGQHLAVIVPVYRGDLSRAVSSLDRWPSTCSPLTEKNADLVLYYAEGEQDAPAVTAAVDTINENAGRCFAKTRLVYAHLSEEEDVYPKGPSVMFFKMFLDEGVHSELSEYDALAIVEWDVLVASDRSFEELHHAAFRGNEDFWMKGSNLGGTNFHSTAQVAEMWNMLGHINGNAIYNNNDPAFVEYVDYTRARWDYTYPYDVALWLTISDFPYSWPLWQRYSSKFVTTNLISYVGFEHVDHTTVSDAVAGQTLFIHGSRVEEGNLASLKATKHERKPSYASVSRLSDGTENPSATCNAACGSKDTTDLPVGTSTVCDDTCNGEPARFGGFLCGAGDSAKFGDMCRLCYVDIEEARRQEQSLALTRSELGGDYEASHVIMCNTMRPPEAAVCSDKCGRKSDTVCDESCGTGLHGDYNCNWRDHGAKCRFCFHDIETALLADTVAQRRGGRVIMCSTFEPPQTKEPIEPEVVEMAPTRKRATQSRKLQAWKDNEKWKTSTKWQDNEKWRQDSGDDDIPKWQQNEKWKNTDDDEEPKWKQNEKWKNNYCDEDDCPHTNSNGYRGRVCDETCSDGDPYGTNGCSARDGAYGDYCRVCYIDRDRAIANDDPDDRAIMCSTVLPVTVYESTSSRRLSASIKESAARISQKLKVSNDSSTVDEKETGTSPYKHKDRKLQAWKDNEKWKTSTKWQDNEKWKQDSGDDDIPKWQQNEKWKNTDDDEEPKWKQNEKWKNNYCDEDDCPHTNSNGYRGRVCDETCSDGDPYGTNGCSARDGAYGDYCRVCYNDRDRAIANDDPDDRAIMCSTVLPVTAYESTSSRRLSASTKESAPRIGRKLKALKGSTAAGESANGTSRHKRKDRKLQTWRDNEKWKTSTKWQENEKWKQDSDDDEIPKWQQNEKWKNNNDDEVPKWRENEKWKNNYCDEEDCPHTNSNGFRGRVCDETCSDGDPYGTNGCSARDGAYGDYCRVCYNDRDRAIANDDPVDRAIMCSTVLPVTAYESTSSRRLSASTKESAPRIGRKLKALKGSTAAGESVNGTSRHKRKDRKLQTWRDNEKWKTSTKWQENEKWKQDSDDDEIPKWQQNEKWKNNNDDEVPKWRENEKWKNNYCDEEDCPHTNSNGFRGRVCDETCSDGDPYGTNGCSARDGAYGDYCRVCYNDRDRAIANDDPVDRAIMCSTVLPVTVYESTSSRRLSASTKKSDSRGLPLVVTEVDDAQSMFADATVLPYTSDLVRGNLCAFVAGHVNEVDQVEVAVMSVLQFLPGMTVAVAADEKAFEKYDRAVGSLPGVTVHATEDPFTASLFADEFCGVDTSLIFYMQSDSVVSREFTSKDTHSTHGDLLVVHGNAKLRHSDRELAKQTTAILGFESPSFTFNTDLFLPVGANADLRKVLLSGLDLAHQERDSARGALMAMDGFMKLRDMSAVPQVMAALAYSRNTPGVWFIDPQTWVSQHLFKAASIWEIPLVKPRYTCSIDQSALQSDAGHGNVASILQANLDFFTSGGTCDGGYVDIRLGD